MTRGIRICKNCEFHGDKTCQRHPPVNVLAPAYIDPDGCLHDPMFVTTWPKVQDDDWCGEFRRNVS